MSVSLTCSHGVLDIELFVEDAPRACRNFVELCKSGYYDGITFHRIVPGFMCQTGDPTCTGKGGFSIYGPVFADEISARQSHDRKGIVSMANSGRNTNSSQFFITLNPSPHLDGKHTIFGKVKTHSLRVLDKMQLVPLKKFQPVQPVKLYVAEVIVDPWEGQELPYGASIPVKPLITPVTCTCTIQ